MPTRKRSIRLRGFPGYAIEKGGDGQGERTTCAPAIELRDGQFPPESPPTVERPMKDLELLHVIAKIRHVFGGEDIIWRMGEG